MAKFIQSSFVRGEIAPELYGRVDIPQYKSGLKQAKNCVIHQYGGVSNRGGTIYIGPVKDHGALPRLIPFQFKTTDTHVLEFGNEYIRFLRNDAPITETGKTITNITQANPGVVTVVAHGYADGTEVVINSIAGMTELNNRRYITANATTDTFTLKDQVTLADIDTTTFTAYDTGGIVAKIYTLATPYQYADLPTIKYVQNADVITLVHPNYPPKELRRFDIDNWTLTDIVFRPTAEFPTNLATSGGSDTIDSWYQVTAITDEDEESLPAIVGTSATITNITKAFPALVTTSAAHGYVTGDVVHIQGVVGMTQINDRRFTVGATTSTTFELAGEDSSLYSTYVSDGSAYATFVFNTHSNNITLTWDAVADAVRYRIFKKSQGVFGFIGSTEGVTFLVTGTITPDIADSPPRLFEPFRGTDNYPGAVGYHQQRMVFGGSNNQPDTTYYSVVGDFNNMSHSIPFKDDDAFSATLASEKINDIRHYTSSAKDLMILTSGQEWAVQGTDATHRFTITSIEQIPQTNWGCSQVRPIITDSSIIFVTASGHHVRAAGFSFEADRYIAKELTLYAPHLFKGAEVVDWAYISDPEPTFYIVKDDGKMAILTYNAAEQVTAWSGWETDGAYKSIAAVRPNIDSDHEEAYMVVQRKINGATVGFIERTVDREFADVRDCFFVDCGLSLNAPTTISNITSTNPIIVTSASHNLSNGDTVDIADIVWTPVYDPFGNDTNDDPINDGRFLVADVTPNTFTLQKVDDGSYINGTAYPVYKQGGTVRKAYLSVSGLAHLRNTPVVALVDGGTVRGLTVDTNGVVTLPRLASRVHIGLPYISDIETLNPEFNPPNVDITVQGLKKQVSYVTVRFKESRGLLIGPNVNKLVEMKQREFEVMGEPTALLTGDKEVTIMSDWNLEGTLYLRQKEPLPLTILAIVSNVEVGER